ncbi:MAG: hypothetical protein ABEH59_00540 [Halobacteriales archaeon]
MAIEDRVSSGIERPNWTQLKGVGSRIVRWVILTVAVVAWVIFWGLVARLHLRQGDIASAAVVSLLFVIPMTVGYLYYLYTQVQHL